MTATLEPTAALAIADYHDSPAWSQTALKLVENSPERFHAEYIAKTIVRKASSQQEFGSAVHGMITGTESVAYIPADVLSTDGKRAGAKWKAFQLDNAGTILLRQEEWTAARNAADSVYADPMAKRLLEAPGAFEESIFWTDATTGLACRCRPDKASFFGGSDFVLVDIKTTAADPSSEREMMKTCAKWGYHFQAAFYTLGVETAKLETPTAFVFIFVQTEPPYVVRCYELSERALELGRGKVRTALDALQRRLAANDWRGAGHGDCLPLELPEWCYGE